MHSPPPLQGLEHRAFCPGTRLIARSGLHWGGHTGSPAHSATTAADPQVPGEQVFQIPLWAQHTEQPRPSAT